MHALKTFALALVVTAAMAVPGSALAAAPANDNLADAAELTGRFAFAEGSNAEATEELGEPAHAGNAGGASIWYRWTAPAAGKATVGTCGSEINTLLAVYTGDQIALLTEIAANDDACGEQSLVSFQASEGTSYRIAVDGFGGATGRVALFVNLSPPNDDFAEAQRLTGDSGSVTGTTIGSTNEDGEPSHVGDGSSSVWFEWTAPANGWANFDTCGSTFDTVLAVYAGSAVNQLTAVAGNDDACGLASRVSFQASQGTAYRIAVAGFDDEVGAYTLTWSRSSPPPVVAALPQITGVVQDGETLSASDGQWAGEGPFTYAYAWGRCDSNVDDCDYIAGATSPRFTIRSGDVGHRLWVRVTASNAAGSTAAFSEVTAVVAARPRSPAQARRCIVPNVRGRTLRAARTAIARRGCRVGRIRRAYSARARAGRVVAQAPRAGVRRAFRARVHLVVSRGRRR
jgi:hypothetical protein